MEREACVCDHEFERSDLCAEIIIIIIIIRTQPSLLVSPITFILIKITLIEGFFL